MEASKVSSNSDHVEAILDWSKIEFAASVAENGFEFFLLHAGVLYSSAGSTGRRNTGVKPLCWGFKLQGLTWSFV
jgi:hypothetical protein